MVQARIVAPGGRLPIDVVDTTRYLAVFNGRPGNSIHALACQPFGAFPAHSGCNLMVAVMAGQPLGTWFGALGTAGSCTQEQWNAFAAAVRVQWG